LKYFDKWYDRLAKMKRNDHLSTYLNAITAVYDPHTSYYEPIDKENFDIRMSGKLEGIGARLQSDDEYTKITSIVVGGPAWKQGDLEENDLITAVAQEGEDAVDINGMTINEVVQLIRGKKGTKVILTVKKVNGSSQKITIERDVVITSEGFAKSLMMKTDEGEKVGYIRLPSFYADFQDRNGRRCAKDVATEVEKLKAQNVEGIVIDLRNNGGGSLRDVVKMSGLFVEDGPMVQVKSRDRKPEVLEDTDSSVLWDGHLIIMVNNFSASASEILAAALQDYERAVIVGSPTFGKGTVQRFFDLDRAISGNSQVKPLGQVKLTTQKFYRVNGGSTQLKGVTPDIILPDNYKYIETGEKENEYPLKWTEIAPVETQQNVYDVSRNLDKLKAQSATRIKANAVFSKIDENAKRLKTQRDDTDYPLGLEAYNAEEDAMEEIAKSFEDMFEDEVNMSVENLKVDLPAFEADESKAARNEDFVKNIKKDVYLEEVLNIMDDMIEVNAVAAGKRN
jgi:carboxyl-terminal processing protease